MMSEQDLTEFCNVFQTEFDGKLPKEGKPGWYEHAIAYAFNRIEELDHVKESEEKFTKKTDVFLVSKQNEMGVYKRCVRKICKIFTSFIDFFPYAQCAYETIQSHWHFL